MAVGLPRGYHHRLPLVGAVTPIEEQRRWAQIEGLIVNLQKRLYALERELRDKEKKK